jgi:hypothetical protein
VVLVLLPLDFCTIRVSFITMLVFWTRSSRKKATFLCRLDGHKTGGFLYSLGQADWYVLLVSTQLVHQDAQRIDTSSPKVVRLGTWYATTNLLQPRNRSVLAVYSEDQSIGNFVHSHPLPIHRIRMNTNVFEHPVKRIDRVRTLWRKHAGVSKQQKKQQP